MKAILLSIQPQYCELIASGKKTIEVRKTEPKLQTPFKCYIYETKAKRKRLISGVGTISERYGRGKVIGEFICRGIMHPNDSIKLMAKQSCLSEEEIDKYARGKMPYGLRIADLKIYDKPKELGDFKKAGYMTEEQWLYALYPNTHCHYATWVKRFDINRPPQSWYYVEELN